MFVVYNDENYHQSWVYPEATRKIVNYLSSDERKDKKFEVLDAKKLTQWIKARIEAKDANKTCIVFSQDMVPNVLAPDYSPSIILRTYLDAGGRIVWIGDVPFFRKGKPYTNLSRLKPGEIEKHKEEIWDEWGIAGIFSILGLNVEFNYSPIDKVEITDMGKKWGLREENRWYGTRPIMEKGKEVKVLAQSSAKRYKQPELIKPEEKQPSVLTSITGILSLIYTLITISLGIATGFSSFYAIATGFELPLLILTLFLGALFVGALVHSVLRKFRRKKYANAWIKNFNNSSPDSGFARIWDFIIYDLDESMLKDLFTLSIYNL
jgi:hypothetical protein